MIEFFLRRPIFAMVCSLVILLVGIIAIPTLPVAQYPNIAPPTVTVQAFYTGANAAAVESSVTTPLEQAINGIQGLRYISSQSANDGSMQITATFNLDRNLDQAANDVQNAVNLAQGRLPNEVKLTGVSVSKNNGTFVSAVGINSSDARWDEAYLTDYLANNVVNDIKRIPGVSDVIVFGERKFAMRLWVDPGRLADNGLTAADVTAALSEQNLQVAAGAIGAAPTNGKQPYQYTVTARGRLRSAAEFANVILRANPNGGYVRVKDVGRVALGAENYATTLWFDGKPSIGLGILQLSTGNALDVSRQVKDVMNRAAAKFPPGVQYKIAFDSSDFVRESIKEVVITLLIAVALVILVIFLFLQDWRTTLIPAVTIPISLLGTFFLMKALGFSINTLTLFGLTLATGLVVDDAIVVIENIARFIQEKKMAPFEGARAAMKEISGAVLASSLVLMAVFVPVAFFPGTTGQLYKQFALTIVCSITISLFNALTLTPVLSSLLLGRRPHAGGFFRPVNWTIAQMRRGYHAGLPLALRFLPVTLAVFVLLLGVTYQRFTATPTGFIADEDQGYFVLLGQGPEGVSIDYTHEVQRAIEGILRQQPEVEDIFDVAGFSFNGNGPNKFLMFMKLRDWAERRGPQHSVTAVLSRLQVPLFMFPKATAFAVNPPSIPGLGIQSGFNFVLEDRGNAGIPAMLGAAYSIIGPANSHNPADGIAYAYTLFRNDAPSISIDVDRDKAKSLGVNLSNLFGTMQVYLGSVYVNDFDLGAKSYRVYVQADAPFRSRVDDLAQIYVRGAGATGADAPTGAAAQIPLTAIVNITPVKGPPLITHYNLFRSIEIDGAPPSGQGSTAAINTMERLATRLPAGFGHEWTGITLEQLEGGSQAALIFALGIAFVFLVLAAQYESFADPLIILLAVPLALLGAFIGIGLKTHVSDVFAQVGYVMLIGLASKNAILIVEFANQLRGHGTSIKEAARLAAETRFRPILMTSIAFVLGVTPLVFASGAGSAARNSLGIVVFGGMIVSTVLNLFITPALYVVIASFEERFRPGRHARRFAYENGAPAGAPAEVSPTA